MCFAASTIWCVVRKFSHRFVVVVVFCCVQGNGRTWARGLRELLARA